MTLNVNTPDANPVSVQVETALRVEMDDGDQIVMSSAATLVYRIVKAWCTVIKRIVIVTTQHALLVTII